MTAVRAIPLAEYNAKVQSMSDWLRVNRIAIEHGYDPGELRGPRRLRVLSAQRRVVAKELRDAGWSYPRIGRGLGGKHHTSVMALLGVVGRHRVIAATRGGRR